MDNRILIDSIVCRFAELTASVAMRGGARTPVAHVPDLFFSSLARELGKRGASRKVVADMLGMSHRTLQRRINERAESESFRGQTLWTSVVAYVAEQHGVSRSRILERFSRDDEAVLRSVLQDLVQAGVLVEEVSRRGHAYRRADDGNREDDHDHAALYGTLLVTLHHSGPMSHEQVAAHLCVDADTTWTLLTRGVQAGHVELRSSEQDEQLFATRRYTFADSGPASNWRAALLDHVSALTQMVSARLDGQAGPTDARAVTFSFELNQRSDTFSDAVELFTRLSGAFIELRSRNEDEQRSQTETSHRLTIYLGQLLEPRVQSASDV